MQVTAALRAKASAQTESRAYRLYRQALEMKAELAMLRGERWPRVPPLSVAELRQVSRWRQRRRLACMVAEERGGEGLGAAGALAGAAALTIARPEAMLPPPFPTNKRPRAYISNVAVLPQYRCMHTFVPACM